MSQGIGISGMGRIGRLLVRKWMARRPGDLKAINSAYPVETIAHLLKYDTVHGIWAADVGVRDGMLVVDGHSIRMTYEREPERIPWRSLGADIVVDATGKFNDGAGARKHMVGGARKVIVTAPGERMDLTVVMGVNDHLYDPDEHHLLSAASCTTNCLSPVLLVLDRAFGVERGWMTTVHSYTSDQNHLDNPHKDLRRARACTQSIVPTTTGVGKALAGVLPHLAPRIEGSSIRVPTQDVSLIDLTAKLSRPTGTRQVLEAFRAAAEGELSPYIGYTDAPLVSADFIGNEQSAVIDALTVSVSDGYVKLLAWYDNESGYACRVADLARLVQERMREPRATALKRA
ncbi:type I glyceraldehyde-3-phosphate dehydrogenase [Cohnella sp.]|uniref:type I glyceraldehyde-3-phosphate dehydrogenase n=1 Tax=Cohnella sp. TaxID=1883426 RepID=UPI00356290C4